MSLQLQDPPQSECMPEAIQPHRHREERAHRVGICRMWPPLCEVLTRWRRGVFRFDPEGLELQTGVMALALGLYLLCSPDQWGQRSSNFGLMLLRLWPAPVWACLFIGVGGAQMVALNRAWMTVRCLCAMSGFCLWSFVAILLALDGLPGPSVSVFPVIALSEAWVYLRLRVRGDAPTSEPDVYEPDVYEPDTNHDAPPPRR